MIYNEKLSDNGLYLRTVLEEDCNQKYLNWLNDKKITEPLGTTHRNQTIETIKDFVNQMQQSENDYFFAIIYNNEHIGNIKLGPIDWDKKEGDISYFIGETQYWGRGLATKAVNLVTKFGFEELKLKTIKTQVFETNISSSKVLKKCGYEESGYSKIHKDMIMYIKKAG
ncbi:GNAT family N-acetyltransferase [bacterium]|nr:GNAT family N-acetyltransferase [bacterium]